jgi:hypothetical protein
LVTMTKGVVGSQTAASAGDPSSVHSVSRESQLWAIGLRLESASERHAEYQ